jgi:hypothetical protein
MLKDEVKIYKFKECFEKIWKLDDEKMVEKIKRFELK